MAACSCIGTAQEWHRLIYEHGLTISTNLFGTTYYSLVGLHAFHVTVGLVMLAIVLLSERRRPRTRRTVGARRRAVAVLAFRRCRVGRRVHRGVHHRPLRRRHGNETADRPAIEVPAPTAWPLVLATGFTLMFAGLLTSVSVSVLGAVLSVAGCVGWFREVVPARARRRGAGRRRGRAQVTTERRVVERLAIAPEQVRAWLPVHTYPVSAGVKGGWAGSVAMAVLACAYGLLKAGSIWYPINLLAAVVYAQSVKLGPAELNAFHLDSFAIAVGVHGLVSTLVGLLYGAMLPMFPRRPIVLGGLVVPGVVVGPAASDARPRESAAREPHRLVLVHGVAGGLRRRRGRRSWCGSRRCRRSRTCRSPLRAGIEAPGTMSTARRDTAVNALRCLSASTMLVRRWLLAGCGTPPGQPRAGSVALAPNEVVEFGALYADNCAGCHGANGRGGAAIALANPVYLAIVDERVDARHHRQRRARHVDAGVRAARRRHADGEADRCDRQRDPIALEPIRSARRRESAFLCGDVRRRHSARRSRVPDVLPIVPRPGGRGGPKGSAITNDSFLALVSDQGLRTIVIAGRPELGAPDWRGNVPGRPMSDQEVTDVVSLAGLAPRRSARDSRTPRDRSQH